MPYGRDYRLYRNTKRLDSRIRALDHAYTKLRRQLSRSYDLRSRNNSTRVRTRIRREMRQNLYERKRLNRARASAHSRRIGNRRLGNDIWNKIRGYLYTISTQPGDQYGPPSGDGREGLRNPTSFNSPCSGMVPLVLPGTTSGTGTPLTEVLSVNLLKPPCRMCGCQDDTRQLRVSRYNHSNR